MENRPGASPHLGMKHLVPGQQVDRYWAPCVGSASRLIPGGYISEEGVRVPVTCRLDVRAPLREKEVPTLTKDREALPGPHSFCWGSEEPQKGWEG
jgi:hypothetical protein